MPNCDICGVKMFLYYEGHTQCIECQIIHSENKSLKRRKNRTKEQK